MTCVSTYAVLQVALVANLQENFGGYIPYELFFVCTVNVKVFLLYCEISKPHIVK